MRGFKKGPKICPSCQAEIQESKKEKLQRKLAIQMLSYIKMAVPSLDSTLALHKDECFKCFRPHVLAAIGPMAETLLGQQKEESLEDQKEK